MTIDEKLIGLVEQVVGDVMSRLDTGSPDARLVENRPAVPSTNSTIESTSPTVLSEKVITEDVLERHFNGAVTGCLVISANAVVTPTGRDFLKRNAINVTRQTASAASNTGAANWLAVVVQTCPVLTGVLNDFCGTGNIHWKRIEAPKLTEAVELAIGLLCRGDASGVIVFTDEPHTAACRANRNEKIRAAATAEVETVRQVQKQMNANWFCIDSAGRSYFELRNLLRETVKA